MKILILEDERILALSMREFLEESGYEVECFTDSDTAYDAIYEKVFDLLLLDVKVPGEKNGFGMLEELREDGNMTPAIFITSLTDIDDLIRGYECGACDYIRKPFDLAELKLRVEQVMKLQCFASSEENIELPSGYSYDLKKMKLTYHGETVLLAKTETKILELLIKKRGSVVSCEMFWEEVWGEWIDPANIRVQVGNLRKKLEKDFIKNVRGLGYSIDY
ncbi:MAG TPA: response regulator transcription factor [Sulfurovum sp.]|jgi:DNA-binding response OmpR family regulator|nr:MAG: two-component system response regulator [Sulfurovum sp. 35-42-20]OYZ23828.1 MAG: two-component system response regulator [Sulfurovum sp. 16-42-52]OYZ47602.1 MAG: two-component system response regulator [Sulfurovum sp. 24-42-9]HQS72081.1 response regulator transcription factor [Sulfurovum sp.]HQS77772.1 response regulator transcription factor [Sulfurovum sp.]